MKTEQKTLTQLENELAAVRERLGETQQSTLSAETESQNHVEAVAKTGDAGALEDLAVAENLVGVLRRVRGELEAQQSALESQIAEMRESEHRAAQIARLRELAGKTNEALEEFVKARRIEAEGVRKLATARKNAYFALEEAKRAFVLNAANEGFGPIHAGHLGPDNPQVAAFLELMEVEKIDLTGVRADVTRARSAIDSSYVLEDFEQ